MAQGTDETDAALARRLGQALDAVTEDEGAPPLHAFEELVRETRARQAEALRGELLRFGLCALVVVGLVVGALARSPQLFLWAQALVAAGIVLGAGWSALRRPAAEGA